MSASKARSIGLLFLVLAGLSAPSLAAEPVTVGLTVVAVQAPLQDAIEAPLVKALHDIGVEKADRLPPMEIVVFASQDTGDRKNPQGVSIAFAFTTNVDAQQLAVEYVRKGETPPDRLLHLLQGHGTLLHINVAHADEASEEQFRLIAEHIAATFKAKYLDE